MKVKKQTAQVDHKVTGLISVLIVHFLFDVSHFVLSDFVLWFFFFVRALLPTVSNSTDCPYTTTRRPSDGLN